MGTGTSGLASKIIEGAGAATEGPEQWVSQTNMAKYMQGTDKLISSGFGLTQAIHEKNLKEKAEEELRQQQEAAAAVKEWDTLANQALQSGQYMTEEEYSQLTSTLKEEREAFINADNEQKAILLNKLDSRSDQIDDLKSFKITLATSATDTDGIKNNKNFLASNQGEDLRLILSGETKMEVVDGKYGYMIYDNSIQEGRISTRDQLTLSLDGMEDGPEKDKITKQIADLDEEIYKYDLNPKTDKKFMTVQDLESLVEYQSFDRSSNNIITEAAQNAEVMGGQVAQGQNGNFKYESTYNIIMADITENGNMRSLIEDKHVGGKSFEEHLREGLAKATYEDLGVNLKELGIDEASLKLLDPTDDGVITESDINGIITLLKNDKDMADDYVARYYTNFIAQNYNQGFTNSRQIDDEDEFMAK